MYVICGVQDFFVRVALLRAKVANIDTDCHIQDAGVFQIILVHCLFFFFCLFIFHVYSMSGLFF